MARIARKPGTVQATQLYNKVKKIMKSAGKAEGRPHRSQEGIVEAQRRQLKRLFKGKSGGKATHGYGKAYLKGGKVK